MHKGGEAEINYINRFNNAKALENLVGNSYCEYQLIHTFLPNLYQGRRYYVQMASHKTELRREETFSDQKSLSISALKIDYLNLENPVKTTEGDFF